MKKLLTPLKGFEDGHLKLICIELEKFENDQNVVDTRRSTETNDKNYLPTTLPGKSPLTEKHNYRRIINSGLCIIINQKYFRKEVLLLILIKNENKFFNFIFFSMKHDMEQRQTILPYLKHLKHLDSKSRYFTIWRDAK